MQQEKRREELLAAARKVFAKRGYHDAKVDDIVAAAKVAKGTFYLYFPDKRSVFAELVDGIAMRLRDAILRVDVQADIEGQIRHNIRAVVAVLLDEPDLTRMLLNYADGLDPAFVKKVRSFYEAVRFILEKALTDGQKMGIVAPGDTKVLALFTIGALKEVAFELAIEKKPRPREELVEALFALLSRGYLRVKSDSSVSATRSASRSGRNDVRKARSGRSRR